MNFGYLLLAIVRIINNKLNKNEKNNYRSNK